MEERHVVDTSVGRLAVRVVGTGPPALLWHSLFVDDRSWDRLLPHLSTTRRLVVVTGPGHGSSSDPGRRYTVEECADAARAVLDGLDVPEPVDWVGNAWGGHVGAVFASTWPGRCRSLVAFGTPVAALRPTERARTRLLLGLYRLVGPSRRVVDGVTSVLLSPRTRSHDGDAVRLVRDCLVGADRRGLRNAVVSISLRRRDLSERLAHVVAPTLLVTGTHHHGFTPQQARDAARLLSSGSVAIVPDSAYLVPLEAPGVAAHLVLDFWSAGPDGRSRTTASPAVPQVGTGAAGPVRRGARR